jgi:hypothetical protein
MHNNKHNKPNLPSIFQIFSQDVTTFYDTHAYTHGIDALDERSARRRDQK